jgi:hypothetical protein
MGASAFSLLLLFTAYVTSGPSIFFKTRIAAAESTDAVLKAFAAKDTDNDGLPDWQEALYGTDPNNPHSVDPTLTDGEAVAKGLVKPKFSTNLSSTQTAQQVLDSIPGPTPADNSLTAQFSQQFLEQYQVVLANNGGQALSPDDEQTIITNLMQQFGTEASARLASQYTTLSVHTSNTESVTAYAAAVEQILKANDVPKGSSDPVSLMEALIQNQDDTASPKLKVLAKTYTSIATHLAQISVPTSLAGDHLALMQSFDAMGNATGAVVNYQQDPVLVLGSLSIYVPSSEAVVNALQDIATAILANGEPAPGAPGSYIVSVARYSQQQDAQATSQATQSSL